MLLVVSSVDIPVSLNVSTTFFFSLLKFWFCSFYNPVKTIQGFLEYISNPFTFAESCFQRTDVTWLDYVSPPSSAITRSPHFTMRANSLSIVIFCCWITTSEASLKKWLSDLLSFRCKVCKWVEKIFLRQLLYLVALVIIFVKVVLFPFWLVLALIDHLSNW